MLGSRAQLVVIAAGLLVFTVVQVAMAGGSPQATPSAKLKSEVAKLKQRVAALEAKPDQVGQTPTIPPIPTTLPPSGPAGGELAGTYPNPTVGTVAGLDFVPSTALTAGLTFAESELYRSAPGVLATGPGVSFTVGGASLTAQGSVTANGGVTSSILFMPEETETIILPEPNRAILYTRDNGSNKTQIVIQFPSGGVQVLATEP